MVDLIARCSSRPSKSEARVLRAVGGVYVNNRRIADPQARLTREQAIGAACSSCAKVRSRTFSTADLTGSRAPVLLAGRSGRN